MDKNSWGCLLWVVGAVFVIGYLSDITNTKWWYLMSLDVKDDSKITIEMKPHDCEFMTAPLGNKRCHYDKVIRKVMWATSTANNPIYSYNDGKTWEPFTPDPGTQVPKTPTVISAYISWNKVSD